MINNQMKQYKLYKNAGNKNEYGELTPELTFLRTIEIAINNKDYSNIENDIRYLKATHIGLSTDKEIKKDYIVTDGVSKYLVKYVNPFGRLAQITLEEVI